MESKDVQLKTTTRTDRQTKLTLNVAVTGTTGVTANRIFNYINYAATDDKVLYYGNKLGTLSADTVNYVQRTDTAKLVAQ